MKHLAPVAFLLALALLPACSSCSSGSSGHTAPDSGTDTDSDVDTDVDTDSDSDIDSDTDGDTDTWPNGDTAPDGYGEVVEVCWVATFGGPEREQACDVVSYPDGSSVVAGHFEESITFGQGEDNETIFVANPEPYDFPAFIARFDADGAFLWARELGPTSDGTWNGIVLVAYPDGGVVATGEFAGTVTFGEGEPNETTLTAESGDDVFLARYHADGSLVWVRTVGGASAHSHSLGVLPDGSIATAGHVNQDEVFGEGEIHETEIEASGSTRYLARYFADGTLAWAQTEGGGIADSEISATSDGDFLVTGLFHHNTVFGEGQPNETELNTIYLGPPYPDAINDSGLFITSYDSTGELQWVYGAGSISTGWLFEAYPLTVGDGTFLVAGMFYGMLAFDYELPNETVLYSGAMTDEDNWPHFTPELFAARFEESGEFLWAVQSWSGYGNDVEGVNAVLLPDDRFAISGKFKGAANFGLGEPADTWLVSSGEHEPFAAIYDIDGNLEWVARVGSSWDVGQTTAAAGLEDGTFLLAGGFTGTAEFETTEEEPLILTSDGLRDGFLMRVCP